MIRQDYSIKAKVAFTLIELLIAISIFGAVATVVYTTLYTGLKTYHRTQTELKLNQEINQVLDKLSVELKNCYDAEYNQTIPNAGFVADNHNLAFFTIQNSYVDNEFRKLMAHVSYTFKGDALFKKLQLDKDAFLEASNFNDEELLSDIKDLSFEYLYFKSAYAGGEPELEWKTDWQYPEFIPAGIKVQITRYDSDTDISVSLERYIFISQGTLSGAAE